LFHLRLKTGVLLGCEFANVSAISYGEFKMREWITEVNALLEDLSKRDLPFGFSLENNFVSEPSASADDLANFIAEYQLSPTLKDFYLSCGEINWSNVQNGYWIHPLEALKAWRQGGDVTRITGDLAGDVIVCGTTGCGGRFALRPATRKSYTCLHNQASTRPNRELYWMEQ